MIRLLENVLFALIVLFGLLAGGLVFIVRAILNLIDLLKGLI